MRPRSHRLVVANAAGRAEAGRAGDGRAAAGDGPAAAVARAGDGPAAAVARAGDGPAAVARARLVVGRARSGTGRARSDRDSSTSAAYRHHGRAGHAPQRGVRGRQSAAPTSITAWVHPPGRSLGTAASAMACTAAPDSSSAPPPATIRPRTRRTFTSTAPTRRPKARAATARAVYGPTPGSASSSTTDDGTRPPCRSTIRHAARRNASARRS